MADKVPSIRLNSGYDMPMLGLGTYNSFKPNEIGDAVKAAIQTGYRLIDTAWSFETETEIGAAVKELIQEGKIKREELFIVTKLWVHCREPDQVEPACRQSLEALGMDYIDLYLIQFPMAFEDVGVTTPTMTDYLDTWRVILRWGIQRGFAVVPKSTNPSRQAQNMDIFDFKLSEEDMKAMLALDRGYRCNAQLLSAWKDHPYYPF